MSYPLSREHVLSTRGMYEDGRDTVNTVVLVDCADVGLRYL